LAAERGKLAEFAGKQLSEITIDNDEEVEISGDEKEEDAESDCGEASDFLVTTVDDVQPVNNKRLNTGHGASTSQEADDDNEEEQCHSHNKRTRKAVVKKSWTEDERNAVSIYFANDIMNRHLPGKGAIEKFLVERAIDRKWTNVKDFIRNHHFK